MRKIALVGTAGSAKKAPYQDPSWEIWGVSARGDYVTRATRWFEIHRLEGEPEDWASEWRRQLKILSHDVELYMFYPEPDLGPSVVVYPHASIVERFGTYFMSSSFAWMMALAIDELRPLGAPAVEGAIGIWGVDMEHGTEYAQQRAGFRHFIELAKALGIPVHRLASSGLSYEPVPYPMWQDDPALNKARLLHQEAEERYATLNDSLQRTRTLMAQTRVLLEEMGKAGQKGYSRAKRRTELEKQLAGLMKTSGSLSRELTHWQATGEAHHYWTGYLSQS